MRELGLAGYENTSYLRGLAVLLLSEPRSAGACIVRTVVEKLGMQRLIVSDRGLRHGVLADRFAVSDER